MTAQDTVPAVPAATTLLLRNDPQFEDLMIKRRHQSILHPVHWSCPEESPHPATKALNGGTVAEAGTRSTKLTGRCGLQPSTKPTTKPGFCRPMMTTELRSKVFAMLKARKQWSGETSESGDVVREAGVRLRLEGLTEFANWVTPTFVN
jgi:hypothetical protein